MIVRNSQAWWLRDTKYGSPTSNYDANCYMTILSAPNENSVTFGNDACKFHSRSYYCQSLHTTTTTTLAAVDAPAPAADSPSTEWESEGRKVFLYKTAAHVDLRTQTTFCTDKSLHWFSPKSQADAQALITNAHNADNHHTWIQLHGVQMEAGGIIGGHQVTVDDGSCTSVSAKEPQEWNGIRKTGCSLCDPELYDYKSSCWDVHEYDWFACEEIATTIATTTTTAAEAPVYTVLHENKYCDNILTVDGVTDECYGDAECTYDKCAELCNAAEGCTIFSYQEADSACRLCQADTTYGADSRWKIYEK